MSEAWNLFARSLSRGASEYGSFMKIWLMSLIVLGLIAWLILGLAGGSALQMIATMPDGAVLTPEQQMEAIGQMRSLSLWVFLIAIFAVIVISGLSVNSLRYYAGQYTPSWVPFQFDWGTTFAFIGWSIVLGLIGAAVALVPAMIGGSIMGAAYNSGSSFMAFLGWIITFIGALIAYWIIFRLYNKLVGRALGANITLGEAWNKTKGSAAFYLGLTLFIVITMWLFQMLLALVFGLLFGIFTSPTMLAIVGFIFTIVMFLFLIYVYAVSFAIFVAVYQKFFGTPSA